MKARFPLVILLTLVLTSLAYAQEATPSPSPKPAMTRAQSQRIIIATEKRLWEAWKNKDFKVFKANLAPDSVMITDAGVVNKTNSIKDLETVQCDVKSYELMDFKVTFLNDSAALLTYKSTQDASCGGQQVPAAVWSCSAYVRRGGKWWAASHQETTAK